MLVLLFACAMGGCASSLRASAPLAAVGPNPSRPELASSNVRLAKPPQGFIDFCDRFPLQCELSKGVPQRLSINPETKHMLEAVNTAFNQSITPEEDRVHYGVHEYWTIPTDGYGDCDDYVLAKRNALIELGIPVSALRIAIVFTPRFVRHSVLIVATDHGNYVLDNLRDDIVTWDKTEYGWIKGQNPASS